MGSKKSSILGTTILTVAIISFYGSYFWKDRQDKKLISKYLHTGESIKKGYFDLENHGLNGCGTFRLSTSDFYDVPSNYPVTADTIQFNGNKYLITEVSQEGINFEYIGNAD